ncbi:MAG: hypothetical protein WCJ97_04190 [Phycisphaerae bacterium]
MANLRPTFHESWYRVAGLHPRLRTGVRTTRQTFRGRIWFVVGDTSSNNFFRFSQAAYHFIGLLDGRRTVAQAWDLSQHKLGDLAPTQVEAVQLLGQLYTANLLQAEANPDADSLFSRYRQRRGREIKNIFANIMFARIPLWDPERFLEHWLPVAGWIFSPIGLMVWVILIGMAGYCLIGVAGVGQRLRDPANGILAPSNLLWLYVAFALVKYCHEMGHAFACKKFGLQALGRDPAATQALAEERPQKVGGEVHEMGIMLLVFTPVPYVDASSSWALANKWQRIMIAAAGMWVELAIASVATMVWVYSGENTILHGFCYNIMFVSSVSTVIFNINPLLRYDGYYMLADWLEMPNLAQRGKDMMHYLVKRFVWGVKTANLGGIGGSPAYSRTEAVGLPVYAIAALAMRVVVTLGIVSYLASVLQGPLVILALALGLICLVMWGVVPCVKFVRYLLVNPELNRQRGRALATTLGALAILVTGLGFIPLSDPAYAQGDIAADAAQELFVAADGIVANLPVAWMGPVAQGDTILTGQNPVWEAKLASLQADRARLTVRRDMEFVRDVARAQVVQAELDGVNGQITKLAERIKQLQITAPLTGTLVAPRLETAQGMFLARGEHLGTVSNLQQLRVRVTAENALAGALQDDTVTRVELRPRGRADILLEGKIKTIVPAGQRQLPSAALGYMADGKLATSHEDREGRQTVELFFEVTIDQLRLISAPPAIASRITTDASGLVTAWNGVLNPKQRMEIRFERKPKPLITQAWLKIQQTFQRKFSVIQPNTPGR